jgi:cell fate (sporulation/competence/biofilm development) regulator YmcA (YheA/YmcA/DUF963 family)
MTDRNDLLTEADELAEMILQSPEIVKYKEAEKQMQSQPEATAMLRRVKELQEQVAEFQARNVPPLHFSYLLEETESIFAKLDMIPEVKAFQFSQTEVNDLLQAVTRRLARAVLSQVSEVPDCEDC